MCDMLCTKSRVYVDKDTKCCAPNHICMSPRLLKNTYVSSSVVRVKFGWSNLDGYFDMVKWNWIFEMVKFGWLNQKGYSEMI